MSNSLDEFMEELKHPAIVKWGDKISPIQPTAMGTNRKGGEKKNQLIKRYASCPLRYDGPGSGRHRPNRTLPARKVMRSHVSCRNDRELARYEALPKYNVCPN